MGKCLAVGNEKIGMMYDVLRLGRPPLIFLRTLRDLGKEQLSEEVIPETPDKQVDSAVKFVDDAFVDALLESLIDQSVQRARAEASGAATTDEDTYEPFYASIEDDFYGIISMAESNDYEHMNEDMKMKEAVYEKVYEGRERNREENPYYSGEYESQALSSIKGNEYGQAGAFGSLDAVLQQVSANREKAIANGESLYDQGDDTYANGGGVGDLTYSMGTGGAGESPYSMGNAVDSTYSDAASTEIINRRESEQAYSFGSAVPTRSLNLMPVTEDGNTYDMGAGGGDKTYSDATYSMGAGSGDKTYSDATYSTGATSTDATYDMGAGDGNKTYSDATYDSTYSMGSAAAAPQDATYDMGGGTDAVATNEATYDMGAGGAAIEDTYVMGSADGRPRRDSKEELV